MSCSSPGGLASTKVLTTYAAPEDAIIDGMGQVCAKAGIARRDWPDHPWHDAGHQCADRTARGQDGADHHQGFRDVIEMRTESRFEQYDLNLRLPDPLLPRNRRYTVRNGSMRGARC
jgi:N-methylhydantoinase A